MLLGFKETFPWKDPTNFREKILAPYFKVYPPGPPPVREIYFTPKIHTMRVDQFDRWKPDMSIQMVYRGPKYSIKDHFNKGITELEKCKSIQKIEIKFRNSPKFLWPMFVKIDGRPLDIPEVEKLATNDGFRNTNLFFAWFNQDFTGKIIHWTDFRY